MNRYVIIVLWALLASAAHAGVLRVPEDFATPALAAVQAQPGDEIAVGEGTFYGVFKLADGVTLRGAGRGKTILEAVGAMGPVLFGDGAKEIVVTGVTFRHTGERVADDKLHLVRITGGSARFSDCAFNSAWESGLYANEKAEVAMENCAFTGAALYACYARDNGTKLTISDSTMDENRNGLGVSHGAEARAERLTIRKTGRDGMIIFAAQTRFEGVDCVVEESGRNGIRAENFARIDLKGCRASASKEEGGFLFGGVKADLVDCAFDENEGMGLSVHSSRTRAKIDLTSFSRNGRAGTLVSTGAEARLSNCVFENNDRSGIAFSNWDTKGELVGSTLRENYNGAWAETGATVVLTGNTFERNRGIGIGWRDAGTSVEESGNTYADNAGGEAVGSAGWPENISKQVWNDEIGFLFAMHDFKRMEYLADRLRSGRVLDPDGFSELDNFYYAVRTGYWNTQPGFEKEWDAHVQAYIDAYPESITPRMVQASSIINLAWRTRGWREGEQVTEKQRARHKGLLERAVTVLEEAEAMNAQPDPRLYRLWVDAGAYLDYDEERLWELMRKGQSVDPLYFPLYSSMADALTPARGGSSDAMERLADDVEKTLGGDDGIRYYAMLSGHMATNMNAWLFAEGDFLDWERINRGYELHHALFPENSLHQNGHAWLACMYGERERAAPIFQALNGYWRQNFWNDQAEFRDWELWAQGERDRPELPYGGDIDEDSAYYADLYKGTDSFFFIIGMVFVGAVIVATLFTVVVFVVLRLQERRA